MKLMDTDQLIATACTDERLLSAADQQLFPLLREAGLSDDFLSAGLKAGRYKSREIQLAGKPLYVVYFTVGDKTAYFVAAASVSNTRAPHLLFEGLEIIARQFRCERIVFNTKRAGLVRFGVSCGYETRGVAMEKKL